MTDVDVECDQNIFFII